MAEDFVPRVPGRDVPWRRLLFLGGALLLAVWLVVGLGSRPLDHGNTSGIRGFNYTDDAEADPPVRTLQYEPGKEGSAVVSLSNNASFTVTVTEVELFPTPGEPRAPIVQDDVFFEPEPREGVEDELRSLEDHEARLSPNRQIRVYVAAHFEGCELVDPGFAVAFGQMTVHYRYLGLPRTAVIPLRQQLEVPVPESCGG